MSTLVTPSLPPCTTTTTTATCSSSRFVNNDTTLSSIHSSLLMSPNNNIHTNCTTSSTTHQQQQQQQPFKIQTTTPSSSHQHFRSFSTPITSNMPLQNTNATTTATTTTSAFIMNGVGHSSIAVVGAGVNGGNVNSPTSSNPYQFHISGSSSNNLQVVNSLNNNPINGTNNNNNNGINLSGLLLKNRWKIQGLLGQGSFGSIYSAHDLVTSDEVAVKVEKVQLTKNSLSPSTSNANGVPPSPPIPQTSSLKVEVCALKNLQSCRYVVTYIHSGRQYVNYGTETIALNFLVMERLGENLAELRRKTSSGVFSIATTMRCGVQMIECVEEVHKVGFLHRDIKPANFVTGKSKNAQGRIYLIDFGLARAYKHEDGNLKPPRKDVGFRGTPRYASVNAHNGIELSRRDDLWSVFYVMVEMVGGNLPWRRIRDKPTIGKLKETHTFQNTEELLRGLPPQFTTMLNYLKKLSFESEPDYDYLKNICKSYFAPHKDSFDSRSYDECQFEWISKSNDLTHDSSSNLSQELIITTNPDRTDSRSRTTKLSTSVFFGSTHLSANSNIGNQAAAIGNCGEFSKSLPDMYKKKGHEDHEMNEEAVAPGKKRQKKKRKNRNEQDQAHNNSNQQLGLRPEKQPHCKCTIM
ncbi:hypothetical protein C9374_009423 [Naegleria lovaniensis]|uniref:non-specific serine/threonine protein kinase n=1 Tax=Naegleria lovaniensis TaxID=51637 RepID=A0AA88H4T4_NAELO|nr:uncharacterized protein C9374_009423 [Naegleria lovaniensis]KAG2392846.1 hypothetical protein C9374_009423 [Naegleria lovaniensis]